MPTTRLVGVRSYIEPSIYEEMEEARATMRRYSRSRFIEDAILEKVERIKALQESSPAHKGHRRSKTAA